LRVLARELRTTPASSEAGARLAFRRVGGRTVIESALAASPLRLLTPRNHGRAAWAYTSTLGGGLVEGDRIRLRVSVGRDALALLASQGHNRVYRSVAGGCGSALSAEVEEGAFLAVLPDPTVCFAGARYEQKTALRLAPGAAAIVVDVLAAGRGARGERWAFDRYAADLEVTIGNHGVLRERTLLDPRHGPLAERLGRVDALGTIVIAGDTLRSARAALVRELASAPLRKRADIVEQANDLGDALHVRFAAVSIEDAIRTVRTRLAFVPTLLGDDPWARRP
jgi:urease accessory protein